MGTLCSTELVVMRRQLDEASEIVQTMVEVEEEDKELIRKLSKSLEMMNILCDQYDGALQAVGDLLPDETASLVAKLRANRAAMPILQPDGKERKPLVRPSDKAIANANTKRVAGNLAKNHTRTRAAMQQQLSASQRLARDRMQKRLAARQSMVSPSSK